VRFPAGSAAHRPEDWLGELACALEARLVCHGRRPRESAERVELTFDPAAVPASEQALLAAAGELTALGAPRARLLVPPAELRALASRSPAARGLACALEAALSAPGAPSVMGIVNVTPDSFSDGGQHLDPARAIAHGRELLAQGADWLDVGGESTRPGAEPVPAEVECERVLPVVLALAAAGAELSIDTTKASVAREALGAGARVVNDVSAGRVDPELLPLVAERGAGLILMHMQGSPRDMQRAPRYDDVVDEVARHLRARARAAWLAGVAPARIALDPGLGFGKELEHNLALMRALPELRSLGFPLALGVSRKSFLGRLSGEREPARRGSETLAMLVLGAELGAELHRVHEVAPARAALSVVRALVDPGDG